MATYSASSAFATFPVKAQEKATQTVFFTFSGTISLSVSDKINIAKLPRGARICDAWFGGSIPGVGGTGWNLGDPGDFNRHGIVSLSSATAPARPAGLGAGFKFSMSDDVVPNDYWLLGLTVASAASTTNSISIHGAISYCLD